MLIAAYGSSSSDVVPAGGVEAAEDPRVDGLERVGVLLLEERLHRREERRDRDACEDERGGASRAARRAPDDIGERDRRRAADERGEREQVVAPGAARAVDEGERRAEAGAGRHAEQVRVGERVAERPLVGRAGDREQPADEQPMTTRGGADLPEDRRVGLGEPRVHAEERHVRGELARHRRVAEVGRADEEAARQPRRRRRERRPGTRARSGGAPAAAPRVRAGPRPTAPRPPPTYLAFSDFSALATART